VKKQNSFLNFRIFIPTFLAAGAVTSLVFKNNPFDGNIAKGYKTDVKTIKYTPEKNEIKSYTNTFYLPEDMQDVRLEVGNIVKTSYSKSYKYDIKSKKLNELIDYVRNSNLDALEKKYDIKNVGSESIKLVYPENIDYESYKNVLSRDGYITLLSIITGVSTGLFACALEYNPDKKKIKK